MMRKAAWIATVLLAATLLPWSALGEAPSGGAVQYTLKIDCPGTRAATGGAFSSCPVRAVDSEDMMGAPELAVDPVDPSNLIIASLHGGVHNGGAAGLTTGVCDPGPTPKSRCGQVFTTFTSDDHGASWVDNPFVPPQDVGQDAYGEHPGITIDPNGHVYVGSLHAMPKGSWPFQYLIAA